ncbi:serine protease [Nocardia sp. NPDC051750]|uniref:serine protease n=1 Tax=Nocardia sp. NPDC051750 TaxID=3364325 RepID=UPI0037AB10FC
MPVHPDLKKLLKAATAMVSADRPDAEPIGTAFRIAPDYAVTAAHVAVPAGPRLWLTFGEGSECGATLAAATPQRQHGPPWGFDDLAVLRLDRPGDLRAPSVLMAEPVLQADDELLICALNASYSEQQRFLEHYEKYRVRDNPEPHYYTVDGDRAVRPGMSGAPVWSVRLGGVVGLVKASENIDSAQGGAVSCLLEGLRRRERDPGREPGLYRDIVTAHDAHHRDEQVWVDLLREQKEEDDERRKEVLIRRRMVETHGWLARIPADTECPPPQGLVDELFRDSLLEPDMKRLPTLRDLVEYIGTESTNWKMELSRFCKLAPGFLLLPPDVVHGLDELPRKILLPWEYPKFEKSMTATRPESEQLASPAHPELEQPVAAAHPESFEMTTLFGVIVPDEGPRLDSRAPIPHRYELAVKTGRREIISPKSEGRFDSYERAKQELKRALDSKLGEIAKPPEAVEIVVALPDDHLTDDPLYEWRRSKERPFSKFTMRLRRSSTWEKTNEEVAELQERWDRLEQSASDGMIWFGCRDARAQDLRTVQDLFVPRRPPDGVGVSQPPTVAVLTAAGSNALPVTVWHTSGCAEHPDGGEVCDGTSFRADMSARIDEQSPVDWYAAIWREQRDHAGSADRDEFWRKIVCIIDRPGESRCPPPLAGPATRELI